MRIYFERSGGFMGVPIVSWLDTAVLPDEEALNLQTMLQDASFFELPTNLKSSACEADHFQYKLIVEDQDTRHAVETTDMAAPDTLRPLLRKLTLLARKNDHRAANLPN